jgi:hypothetical protein
MQADALSQLRAVVSQLAGEMFGGSDHMQKERELLHERIQGYDKLSSPSYAALEERGLTDRRFPEIVSLFEVLADQAGLSMDRECKRRKPVLFRWADSHWRLIELIFWQAALEFKAGERMSRKPRPQYTRFSQKICRLPLKAEMIFV